MAEERRDDSYDELRDDDEPEGVERAREPGDEQPTPPGDGEYRETAPELGVLNRDYAIPGVDPSDTNPYRWHTGRKRDHGGEDAIEIIDLV